MAILGPDGKPTEELKACESYSVMLAMRTEDGTQKLARTFTMKTPCDLNFMKPENEAIRYLKATLFIVSGSQYQEIDPKRVYRFLTERLADFEEFIRYLRDHFRLA